MNDASSLCIAVKAAREAKAAGLQFPAEHVLIKASVCTPARRKVTATNSYQTGKEKREHSCNWEVLVEKGIYLGWRGKKKKKNVITRLFTQ